MTKYKYNKTEGLSAKSMDLNELDRYRSESPSSPAELLWASELLYQVGLSYPRFFSFLNVLFPFKKIHFHIRFHVHLDALGPPMVSFLFFLVDLNANIWLFLLQLSLNYSVVWLAFCEVLVIYLENWGSVE